MSHEAFDLTIRKQSRIVGYPSYYPPEYPSYYLANTEIQYGQDVRTALYSYSKPKEFCPNIDKLNPSLLNLFVFSLHLPADLAFHATCGNQFKFQILYQWDNLAYVFLKPIPSLMTLCSENSCNQALLWRTANIRGRCLLHRLSKPCYRKTQFDL